MPLQELSRECIYDAFMYKRDPAQWSDRRFRALYGCTMQRLRAGQLAPHKEQKMLAGRYLKMQTDKRSAPEIVVTIRDGLVQVVRSTNPYTQVWIADYDIDYEDEAEARRLNDAEERASKPDMHVVY